MTDMNVVDNSNPSTALSGLMGSSAAGSPAVTGQEGIIQGTMGDFQAQIEALLGGEMVVDSVYKSTLPDVVQAPIDPLSMVAATTTDVHFDFNIENALAALTPEELTALQTNVEQALAETPQLDLGNIQETLAALTNNTIATQGQTVANQTFSVEQAQNIIGQFGLEGFSPDELVARINGLHTGGMTMNSGHLLPMQAAVTTLPLEQIAQQYGLTVDELTAMSKTPVIGQMSAKMESAQAATEQAIPQDGIAKLQSLIASAKGAAGETSKKSMSQTTIDASTSGEMVSEAKAELSRMRGEAQMVMTENANTRAKARMAMTTNPQNTAAQAATQAASQAATNTGANKATDTAPNIATTPNAQGVSGEAAAIKASFDSNSGQFGQQSSGQQGQPQQQAWRTPEMLNYAPGTTMPITNAAFSVANEAALMEFEMGSFANIAGGMTSLRGETSIMGSQNQTPHGQQAQTAADQVGLQVSKAVAGGNQQFTIKLTPEDLGSVMVKLAFDDSGKVSALVSADSAQALEMLKQDAKTIERAMEMSGHKADAGSIQFELHDKEGESESRAMAEAVQQDKLDADAQSGEQQKADELNWSEEEEISLEDILANVSPETGIDVRI